MIRIDRVKKYDQLYIIFFKCKHAFMKSKIAERTKKKP